MPRAIAKQIVHSCFGNSAGDKLLQFWAIGSPNSLLRIAVLYPITRFAYRRLWHANNLKGLARRVYPHLLQTRTAGASIPNCARVRTTANPIATSLHPAKQTVYLSRRQSTPIDHRISAIADRVSNRGIVLVLQET